MRHRLAVGAATIFHVSGDGGGCVEEEEEEEGVADCWHGLTHSLHVRIIQHEAACSGSDNVHVTAWGRVLGVCRGNRKCA